MLLVSLLLMGAAQLLFIPEYTVTFDQETANRFNTILHEKEDKAQYLIDDLAGKLDSMSFQQILTANSDYYQRYFAQNGIAVFGYLNDTLVFWSNSSVPADRIVTGKLVNGVVQLRNGWYERICGDAPNVQLMAYILIKHDYGYENKYLSSDFHSDFTPIQGEITRVKSTKGIKIHNTEGKELFTIVPATNELSQESHRFWMAVLFTAGLILLLLYFYREIAHIESIYGTRWSFALFFVIICGVRYLLLSLDFPAVFSYVELFDPSYYAHSFWFPSLGDFLINAMFLFAITQYLNKRVQNIGDHKTKYGKGAIVGLFMLAVLLSSHFINDLFKGLIYDSNIDFNITNLFDLSTYSFLGIVAIGLTLFAYFLLIDLSARAITWLNLTYKSKLMLAGTTFIVFGVAMHLLGYRDLIIMFWPVVLLILAVKAYTSNRKYNFGLLVILLTTLSFVGAHTLTKYTLLKERDQRHLLGDKLATDKDPVMEYLFFKVEERLLDDKELHTPFDTISVFEKSDFDYYLKSQYFRKEWDKFDIKTLVFDAKGNPIGKSAELQKSEHELNEIIRKFGAESDFSDKLQFIENAYDNLSYVIKLEIETDSKILGAVFVELRSKLVPNQIGFPELLLDRSTNFIHDLTDYSYARYLDGQLINQHGNYRYNNTPQAYLIPNQEDEKYDHMVFEYEDKTVVVLTKEKVRFLTKATTFSYLFAIFSLLTLLVLLFKDFPKGFQHINLSLKNKIQLLLVGVIMTSMILFGLGTYYNNTAQFNEKNRNLLGEKIRSVLIELSHKQAKEGDEYVDYITKFSTVFFSDINLYDLDGNLIVSSRPEVFEEGLVAPQMHPKALVELLYKNKSEYIHEERIGNLTYLSAYVPFITQDGEVLSYLNLPYFAKQSDFEKETSDLLIAMVNIFVLLFALSIMAALFVSNWITKPLRIIQQNLSSIRLGQKNQQIQFSSHDEVGELIAEYNKMVEELEHNAALLAKSERESAWREMAQQVAHEIKNPLTPMKLNVQHLQRSLNPESPDWKEKLGKFSSTLIEQIETLAHIANEFSNFAKMPKAQNEGLSLSAIVQSTVELYSETENTKVKLNNEVGNVNVFADKDQLVRVFNNLVKNAVQAIPEDTEGEISVTLSVKGSQAVVEVKDNGIGIEDDKLEKIFMPNFTTKTGGMGLGLAMVKNIIENANGKIWFKTQQGVGTSFFVSLPLYRD